MPRAKSTTSNGQPKLHVEHMTICLTKEQKASIERQAENIELSASPFVRRYLFDKAGKLRPLPPR